MGETVSPAQPQPSVPAPPPELASVIEKAVTAVQMGAVVTADKVAEFTYTETRRVEQIVSYDDAQELLAHFEKKGYVTKSGAIKDAMKAALAAGTLDLPKKFEAAREKFENVIAKANTKPPIQDASKEVRIKLKKEVMISPEFLELWDKIKGRTAYRVQIDEAMLKERCIAELARSECISKAKVVSRTARINVEQSGVSHIETELRTSEIKEEGHRLPDFLRMVDNECFLSQKTVAEILIESGRVQDFLNNPQRMSELFIEAVRAVQNAMEIDGIRYIRLQGEEYYLQEIFDNDGGDTQIVIASFDSDFFQLINDNISILRYRGKNTLLFDRMSIQERFGISPEQYADFKSLTGDASDNIRGADKIGPKTATSLLRQFGNLQAILDRADEIKKPSIQASVKQHAARLRNNYHLIKLDDRAEIPFVLNELAYSYNGITTNEVLGKIGVKDVPYKIITLDPKDYEKCNNIWDMQRNAEQAQKWLDEILSGVRKVFIYVENGVFIGEGALVFDNGDRDYTIPGQRVYLSRMIVKQEHRNQGIGGIILDFLIREAQRLRFSEMALGVDKENTAARHLYEKKGFNTILFDGADEYGEYLKLLKLLDTPIMK